MIKSLVTKTLFKNLAKRPQVTFYYNELPKRKIADFSNQVRSEVHFLMHNDDAYQLAMAAEATQKVPGVIADVGCYAGGSTKILARYGKKSVHAFDTFSGLPETSTKDEVGYKVGMFAADEATVGKYLKDYEVTLHSGFFPDTAQPLENEKFSLVHLDMDTYESTKAGFEFFYPRMSTGGGISRP